MLSLGYRNVKLGANLLVTGGIRLGTPAVTTRTIATNDAVIGFLISMHLPLSVAAR